MIACVSGAVLVVDDDPVFRGLARRILTACGLFVVGEASSVEAAIEAAERLRPGSALVDVGLPDGDGIALAERLVAMPWRLRVVLTSSDPDAATRDDVRRVGAAGFVAKDELPNAPLKELLGPG
jgi:DNA-binding NarL/FixJ family response regulator